MVAIIRLHAIGKPAAPDQLHILYLFRDSNNFKFLSITSWQLLEIKNVYSGPSSITISWQIKNSFVTLYLYRKWIPFPLNWTDSSQSYQESIRPYCMIQTNQFMFL